MLDLKIGFSKSNSLTSKIIRWVTNAPVSHTYISFFDYSFDQEMVLEANEHGYVLVPYNRWIKENTQVYCFDVMVAESLKAKALFELSEHMGDHYDTIGALGLFFRRWLGRYRNPLAAIQGRVFCSEMVSLYLKKVKILPNNADCESYTPGDLLDFCKSCGFLLPL